MDHDIAKALALKVWKYKEGEMVGFMIHIGRQFDLFAKLSEHGPATSEQFAEATGLDERWVREWLQGMAAADIIDRTTEAVFSITEEQHSVMVEPTSLFFAAGAFIGGVPPYQSEMVEEAMRTGIGYSYADQGERISRQLDDMNVGWHQIFLPEVVFPLIDVVDKLEAGATMIDVGCGGATTLQSFAARWPKSTFHGIDPNEASISIGEERHADTPNVKVWVAGGEDLPTEPTYDIITTLDILHDLAHPQIVINAIRKAIKDDGVWLAKDIKAFEDFEDRRKNPVLAMSYGYSMVSCLASSTATPDGAGLGTQGLTPELLRSMALEAGFTDFTAHKTADPNHYYYEIRP